MNGNEAMDSLERDELISAYLDGEVTPDERALVQSRPELKARAEELRRASDLVASPVAVDRSLRQQHISRALAESATSPTVTSIETRRWPRLDSRVIAAAAVVLVALVALPFAFGGGDDETDTTAIGGLGESRASSELEAQATTPSDTSADAADGTGSDAVTAALEEADEGTQRLLEVGEVRDLAELAERVRAEATDLGGDDASSSSVGDADAGGVEMTSPVAETPPCTPDELGVDGFTASGRAIVDGDPVEFVLVDTGTLLVFEPGSCSITDRLDLG